jgi:GDP-L-fucose synthase
MLGSGIAERWRLARPSDELVAITRADVDLRDGSGVRAMLERVRPDAVIHAAAVVGGISAKLAEPTPYLLENLAIDASVLRGAIGAQIPELLYVSSGAIYPEASHQPIAEDSLLTGPLEAANEGYALAKIAAGKVCEYASRQFGFAYRVVAPSNLYGPNDDYSLGHGHLIAATLAKVHAAKESASTTVSIWGDGTARREFTYAPDLAGWLVSQIGSLSAWPALLNVGSGMDHTIAHYYETARSVVGFDGDFEFDLGKPAGVHQRLLDSSRARKLGWSPTTGLADGMAECYRQFITTSRQNGTEQ